MGFYRYKVAAPGYYTVNVSIKDGNSEKQVYSHNFYGAQGEAVNGITAAEAPMR